MAEDPEFWLPPQFDTESSDEEDFLASLTQRLRHSTLRESQRQLAPPAMSGSPQSTLTGFRSWSTVSSDGSPNGPSQAPSPPTTPFAADNNTTWDLIYAATGQVARLKSTAPAAGLYSHASPFGYGAEDVLFKPEWDTPWGRQTQYSKPSQQPQTHQIQRRGGDFHHENGRFGRPLDSHQSAWPSLQVPKKECAGTGVFLPRRYDNPPQPRKRTGKPVQACQPTFQDLNRSAAGTASRRPALTYDALTGRRNAIFAQQRLINHHRPTGANSHELLLPQEWTY